jgi:Ulp1 family protease
LNIELHRKDLQTLTGLLNDNVIECFMALIVERARLDEDLPKLRRKKYS